MDIKIEPRILNGKVKVPPSKSVSHRVLISAALASGTSEIRGIMNSKDIIATTECLKSMGANITEHDGVAQITGISSVSENVVLDCCESGSTLRFLIPVAAALGINATFIGKGRLPERPIIPYLRELSQHGIEFNYNGSMPFSISGKLSGGKYEIEGDISSQFITGLLFALPLCKEDSEIHMLSPLQSKPYADMTIETLRRFGIFIKPTDYGYYIEGNQRYKSYDTTIEGDYSQAAFFYVANALGSKIELSNLSPDSKQGDKKILDILSKLCYNDEYSEFNIDVSDIPDLVPILAVLGSFGKKPMRISNAERLKIKESDRLLAISEALNAIGGKVVTLNDGIVILPVEEFYGGVVNSYNDHRIVMAVAIASTKSKAPIIIKDAESVDKSYPGFFDEFNALGGNSYVISLE